jgi:hypothetical protein
MPLSFTGVPFVGDRDVFRLQIENRLVVLVVNHKIQRNFIHIGAERRCLIGFRIEFSS